MPQNEHPMIPSHGDLRFQPIEGCASVLIPINQENLSWRFASWIARLLLARSVTHHTAQLMTSKPPENYNQSRRAAGLLSSPLLVLSFAAQRFAAGSARARCVPLRSARRRHPQARPFPAFYGASQVQNGYRTGGQPQRALELSAPDGGHHLELREGHEHPCRLRLGADHRFDATNEPLQAAWVPVRITGGSGPHHSLRCPGR